MLCPLLALEVLYMLSCKKLAVKFNDGLPRYELTQTHAECKNYTVFPYTQEHSSCDNLLMIYGKLLLSNTFQWYENCQIFGGWIVETLTLLYQLLPQERPVTRRAPLR